jgi:hypothetical protein
MTQSNPDFELPVMPLPPEPPPEDDFPCCSQPAPRCCKSGSSDLLTASEVKVLTETATKVALALGRREAAEDIARTASIDATTDRKKRSHMQTAQAFANQAAGAWAVWEFARDYPYETLQDASDATSGVPGHPEVSEAVRSPQEPCEDPDCPTPLMHTHSWLNATEGNVP